MQRKSIFFCSWKAAKIDFPQIDHDWYTLYKHRRLKWSLILTQAKPIDNPHDASGQLFSSDPSPIIGYACHSMTDSLTNSPLFSKLDRCDVWLVEVVIVADVDDEKHFDESFMQIWKLKFGHKAKLLFRLWAQGLAKSLKLKFKQNCWIWSLVSILLLRLGEVVKWMFGQDFDVKVWSKDFEFWNLIKICVETCFFGKQNSTLGSVVPLAMFSFIILNSNFCWEKSKESL